MRFKALSPSPRVVAAGRRIELSGGPHAVLLLHGWTGWTGRVAPLASRLHDAGHTVVVPRLPGHGTCVADMLQTRADDWVRCAVDEYLDIRDRFERVSIVGTSMGAVLAAVVAAAFDVERVALLAPAFLVRNPFIRFTPVLKWFVPRISGDWDESRESNPHHVDIAREYASYTYTSMAGELYRVQRLGLRRLASLTAETLVVVSRNDESVPPRVADLIEKRSNARRFRKVVVERSNHQLAEHVDRQAVADAVVDWFADRR